MEFLMFRLLARTVLLVLALAVCTFIPVLMALVRAVQVPTGTWPEVSARFALWVVRSLSPSRSGVPA
ncbi:MAG: hypothetical protein C0524_03255 [Rhodobacter sp.]|nr:hypothetical protein [Rhodobacter sp.]